MPSKKPTRATAKASPKRERSRSVGRLNTKSRSRTPSRSRSRSRVAPNKRSKTPSSESKLRRRRSPTPSSDSSDRKPYVALPRILTQSIPDASGDKRSRSAIFRESTPSRFSQRIIEKIETARPSTVVHERSKSPDSTIQKSKWCCAFMSKLGDFIRDRINTSFVAAINIVIMIPLVYWLNLLVFAPVDAAQSNKTEHYTLWGPARPFAGVLWPTNRQAYLDLGCFGFIATYWMLQLLIVRFVPIGFRVASNPDSRRMDYRCNGLFAFIFCLCIFGIAQWSTLPQLQRSRPSLLLPKYLLSFITASVCLAIPCSVIAYIASKRSSRVPINPDGNTGNFLVDFSNGRLTRPHWWGVDWKMFILRPSFTLILLVDLCYVCAQWEQFGRVSPTLMVITAMHFLWVADFMVFEHSHLSSFDVRYEGFGLFAILGLMVVPFMYTITNSYLSTKLEKPLVWGATEDMYRCALLVCSILMFLVGHWIYRASNNQKTLFRRQPNHPAFADMDKISGPYSQRLLAGGWWGFVRHPNYLGDLLMAHAMGVACGCQSFFPWIYPTFLTCLLLQRIWRTENFMGEKYGLSMTMYKKMVPHRLIPKIF